MSLRDIIILYGMEKPFMALIDMMCRRAYTRGWHDAKGGRRFNP